MVESAKSTTGTVRFFHGELERLGPHQPPAAWSLEEAERYCRRFARQSYENFSVVSWLLPNRLRQDFYNVYAYCRWSDDLADEVADPAHSLALLEWWQQQLLLCFSGRPSHPVLLALQQTVHRHHLSDQPFLDLLSAFRQDQMVSRYQDDLQLLDYCTRSANPVGRILLRLADADDESNCGYSDDICTALQLANFCQDMQRDAWAGRIYAPRSRWAEHAVTEQQLLMGCPTSELQSLLAAWVSDTRRIFDRGAPLVHRVPRWLAVDVDLFLRGGRAVLDAIERQAFDVWTKRPVIHKWKKMALLAQSLCSRHRRSWEKHE
jgi:squalene synthase HpnC